VRAIVTSTPPCPAAAILARDRDRLREAIGGRGGGARPPCASIAAGPDRPNARAASPSTIIITSCAADAADRRAMTRRGSSSRWAGCVPTVGGEVSAAAEGRRGRRSPALLVMAGAVRHAGVQPEADRAAANQLRARWGEEVLRGADGQGALPDQHANVPAPGGGWPATSARCRSRRGAPVTFFRPPAAAACCGSKLQRAAGSICGPAGWLTWPRRNRRRCRRGRPLCRRAPSARTRQARAADSAHQTQWAIDRLPGPRVIAAPYAVSPGR